MLSGRVIWITGLSGAGKTTLARALLPHLAKSIFLDGDELRAALGMEHAGFDAQGRKALAMTYARMANLLAKQGFTIVVATISLFHEIHAWNRSNLPNYLEIYLDVPEEERRRRDPKGLYAAEAHGSAHSIAGGTVAVELPLAPHIRLDMKWQPEAAVQYILEYLKQEEP